MIKVTIYADADGTFTGFDMNGHAEYAEAGSDIVCAAVYRDIFCKFGQRLRQRGFSADVCTDDRNMIKDVFNQIFQQGKRHVSLIPVGSRKIRGQDILVNGDICRELTLNSPEFILCCVPLKLVSADVKQFFLQFVREFPDL